LCCRRLRKACHDGKGNGEAHDSNYDRANYPLNPSPSLIVTGPVTRSKPRRARPTIAVGCILCSV
jgi:hypothetical protein